MNQVVENRPIAIIACCITHLHGAERIADTTAAVLNRSAIIIGAGPYPMG